MSQLEIFRGKHVFLTGHTGFKGSWLSMWLLQLGAKVTGYSLPSKTDKDLFVVAGLQEKLTHIEGDVRDYDKLSSAIRGANPDFVFHLAAQSLVRYSYDNPLETFSTNVLGSAHVLNAVRDVESVRSLILVTTDKCYKNKNWAWGYRENDELGGHDPYSGSKAAAEIVFSSYQDSYFNRKERFGAASVRAGNVIGGGDWSEDRIIPDCIIALRSEAAIAVRNPSATRPWQHVLEPLGGYLLLAAAIAGKSGKEFSGAWNFGPSIDANKTVGELVDELVRCWGSGSVDYAAADTTKSEAMILQLNSDKAATRLGWRPTWDFKRTIKETVGWYQETDRGVNPWEYTNKQIRNYSLAYSKTLGRRK